MAPRIYKSTYPPLEIPKTDAYSFLMGPHKTEERKDSNVLFLSGQDGVPDWTIGAIKKEALELSAGLDNLWANGIKPFMKPYPSQDTYSAEENKTTLMVFSLNSVSFAITLIAGFAASQGIIMTLANSGYTATELKHQMRDSRAGLVFVHPDLLPVLEECLLGEENWKDKVFILEEGEGKGIKGYKRYSELKIAGVKTVGARPKSEDVAVLCYSSGTTGLSKGVATTHGNITAVLTIAGRTVWPQVDRKTDRVLQFLPMYHIFGLMNILAAFNMQSPSYIMARFEPQAFCMAIQRLKITFTTVVPPVLVVLTMKPLVQNFDLSSLKTVISGAAPLGSELIAKVHANLPNLEIMQGFGLTETSPTTHLTPIGAPKETYGSIGLLCSTVEVRLVDEDDNDVPEGERGELWVRGDNVMKGYWRNIKATRDSITPDRWFKTGDVALIKNGFYYIVDRKKELIKYKGFQVPPAELEGLLLSHPSVNDVGVIGVQDDDRGTEVPRAYIVPAGGEKQSSPEGQKLAKEIEKWIAGKVSNHKQLRGGVVLIGVIPKSAAGKILRRQLRDFAAAEAKKAKVPNKGKL